MSRKRTVLSPSLFPFLAVLVCTLGTLILLLALVAQNATAAAQAKSENPPTENENRLTASAAQNLIDEAEFRVEQLVSVRDQQVADIEQRRDQIGHVEDHIRRLREQLRELNQQMEIAAGKKEAMDFDPNQIETLRQAIAAEQTKLEQLRETKSDQTTRVVIVPHKGPNGTDRRPVYLECNSRGLLIQPEGVLVPTEALARSASGANPLDAALRVIRHYALQNYGDVVAPYPLIVVRPDGIETYMAARMAMKDWDDQFGYELVPAEMELAFPKPDRLLKPHLEEIVRDEMRKQAQLRSLRSELAQIGSRPGAGGTRKMPSLSAAAMQRQGRASGYREHLDPYGRRYPTTTPSAQLGSGTGQYETGADAVRKLDDKLTSAANEVADGQASVLPDSGYSQQLGDDALNALRGSSGQGLGDQQGDLPGEAPTARPSYAQLNGGPLKANPYTPDEKLVGPSTTNSFAAPGSQSPGMSEQASQQLDPRQAPTAMTGPAGAQSSRPGQMQGIDPQATQQQPNQRPASLNSSPPEAAAELVKRAGQNWALPKNLYGATGTAIVRTLRVQCHGDRFVLLPSRGNRSTEMFGVLNNDVNRATLELATSVRNRISRWGAALPGGRWQPRLEVEIMSGGEQRFYQLEALMVGSGIEVQGRAVQQ